MQSCWRVKVAPCFDTSQRFIPLISRGVAANLFMLMKATIAATDTAAHLAPAPSAAGPAPTPAPTWASESDSAHISAQASVYFH